MQGWALLLAGRKAEHAEVGSPAWHAVRLSLQGTGLPAWPVVRASTAGLSYLACCQTEHVGWALLHSCMGRGLKTCSRHLSALLHSMI